MSKKEHEHGEDYYGRNFVNIQTSNTEIIPAILEALAKFTYELAKVNIITYSNIQGGKPPGGGCVPGSPGCQ